MTTVRMQPASNDCRESRLISIQGCQDGGTARERYHPVLGCNLHRIPDGRDPAEPAYNYYIWACWTESARPANNRSTRLYPSYEMPRSERQVSHTDGTGTLRTDTIRLRASGSGTTLPQAMWLKPDSAT
ncbi:hypothetical protein QBC45DRAFT_353614, partial [Copromyces sp. CBS 386.78]